MLHKLKILPEFYEDVKSGAKNWELRKDDRGYKVGDTIWLKEWDKDLQVFTGRMLTALVIYVLRDVDFPAGLQKGFCVLSLKNVREATED